MWGTEKCPCGRIRKSEEGMVWAKARDISRGQSMQGHLGNSKSTKGKENFRWISS